MSCCDPANVWETAHDRSGKEAPLVGLCGVALRREDATVRLEERADAAVNGGHISRGEQRTIDAQEDAVSRQIQFDRTY
jgi:hypothetical protein